MTKFTIFTGKLVGKITIPGLIACFLGIPVLAQDSGQNNDFNGIWVFNEELSDETDKQVEKAIKKGGGKISRSKKKGKYKYKGGPKEHELYDHISYDEAFHFDYSNPKFTLTYLDGFTRIFYSDGRGRSASASDAESKDYAFASWDNDTVYVEARARDGGKTFEVYRLENGGKRLRVELEIHPVSFLVPIEIVRIFDKRVE